MLRDKSIQRIKEIQTDFHEKGLSEEKILSGFKALKLTECFTEFNRMKSKGYSFKTVLTLLIWMVIFPGKTVSSSMKTLQENDQAMGKDVFYRFKNMGTICWRMMLWYMVTEPVEVSR